MIWAMMHTNNNCTRLGYAGATLGVASYCKLTLWLHFYRAPRA